MFNALLIKFLANELEGPQPRGALAEDPKELPNRFYLDGAVDEAKALQIMRDDSREEARRDCVQRFWTNGILRNVERVEALLLRKALQHHGTALIVQAIIMKQRAAHQELLRVRLASLADPTAMGITQSDIEERQKAISTETIQYWHQHILIFQLEERLQRMVILSRIPDILLPFEVLDSVLK